MLMFASMIEDSARKAEMKVPPHEIIDLVYPEKGAWNPEDYPHFHVFCNVQLSRPLTDWAAHWDNAKIIAGIPEDKLKATTFDDLETMGVRI